jgi:mRNA-degrading endonuclease RelE of RelBE toxin-antitoxin system
MSYSPNFEVVVIPHAVREVKKLTKRHRSFKHDFAALIALLKQTPEQGEPLGKDCFKIRIAIRSKNKGKSGGARVITCVRIVDETVYIVAVYDKSDTDTISDNDLAERLPEATP